MPATLKINSLLRQTPLSKHEVWSSLLLDTLLSAEKSWELLLLYGFSEISENKNVTRVADPSKMKGAVKNVVAGAGTVFTPCFWQKQRNRL